MSTNILSSSKKIFDQYSRLGEQLSSPEVIANPTLISKIAKEHADLEHKVQLFQRYEKLQNQLSESKSLFEEETDVEMITLAQSEIESIEKELVLLEEKLKILLLPPDPLDGRDIIM
ncbi:MAG: PCRF domain-containing protein, partial [Candidatus Latescibacterota bacterium]